MLVSPAAVVRGKQENHPYNGRVQKIGSLAASLATSVFCRRIIELHNKLREHEGAGACASEAEEDGSALTKSMWATEAAPMEVDLAQGLLPTFDCRVGSYGTELEATSLLLWRGYDCCVNSVSDAVHHSRFPPVPGVASRKDMIRQGTSAKLRWLHLHGALPLCEHQANGTLFVKTKREGEGFNPVTNETVSCVRTVITSVHGNLLVNFAAGGLSFADM